MTFKKRVLLLTSSIAILATVAGWSTDGFHFFNFQTQHYFFQFWVSLSGLVFSVILGVTSYLIYKKSSLSSIKYVSISFIFSAISYIFIGYHSSYCQVCSNLSYCASSHSYPNLLLIGALLVFLFGSVFIYKKEYTKKFEIMKLFLFGLLLGATSMFVILFLSITYIEMPDTISYGIVNNAQAFVFVSPILLILITYVYFSKLYVLSWFHKLAASLSVLGFLPQVVHIYICKDCHVMECSEFYVFAGMSMFFALIMLLRAVDTQLKDSANA